MRQYILKRILLVFPTLFGILLINFAIIQFAPGGPVEQTLAKIQHISVSATSRITSSENNIVSSTSDLYRGNKGIDDNLVEEIKKMYGFDKPAYIRFFKMLKDYLTFDFGTSFFRDQKVIAIILDKIPISISLGLWSTLLIYIISIPLGIKKAVKHGETFDIVTSFIIILGYAIPTFLFAIFLIILFAGGSFLDIFPLRGLTSDNWSELTLFGKIIDYFWHLCLPVLSLTIGGFATLCMLTKNSFLDEIHKQYVMTARAKGNSEKKVLYGHVFRNAMLIVIAGFPSALIGVLFTGALLIEIIFSLDGLGLLGYEAVLNRDYPVMFGTLYLFTLFGLFLGILGDMMYVFIDPRINFDGVES